MSPFIRCHTEGHHGPGCDLGPACPNHRGSLVLTTAPTQEHFSPQSVAAGNAAASPLPLLTHEGKARRTHRSCTKDLRWLQCANRSCSSDSANKVQSEGGGDLQRTSQPYAGSPLPRFCVLPWLAHNPRPSQRYPFHNGKGKAVVSRPQQIEFVQT